MTVNRYDNSGVTLSPNGEYVALVRSGSVEVSRIPGS